MALTLEDGEILETRTRPAVTARWRRYALPLLFTALGALLVLPPAPLIANLVGLGLTRLGALLLIGALGVAGTTALARFLGQRPLPTLAAGALALSAGANLLPAIWMGLPMVALGVGWIAVLEVLRLTSGVALTNRAVLQPRLLRKTLRLAYTDIHEVHITREDKLTGSVILETAHGTVAATDLPGHVPLSARIRARTERRPVAAEPAAVAEARARIESLLDRARAS